MTKKRILHLTVSRFWFDLIAQGWKKTDFSYWYRRLWNDIGDPKEFDEVHIRNGYNPKNPFIRLEFKKTELIHVQTKCTYPDGTILIPGSSYGIRMGDILEIRNWSAPLKAESPRRPVFLKDIVRKSKSY